MHIVDAQSMLRVEEFDSHFFKILITEQRFEPESSRSNSQTSIPTRHIQNTFGIPVFIAMAWTQESLHHSSLYLGSNKTLIILGKTMPPLKMFPTFKTY